MEILFLLLAGFFIGWNIGANDSANCVGTTVGSVLTSFRKGVIIVSIFTILGGITAGDEVIKTLGNGILTTSIPFFGILIVLILGGLVVTCATYFGIPVSTSQASVGAVMGAGIAMDPGSVDFSKITEIFGSWVFCPLLSLGLTVLIYFLVTRILGRLRNIFLADRILGSMVILSSCYMAFSLGANNVANCMGPISNQEQISGTIRSLLPLMGGLSIVLGVATFSRRVIETVGKNITPLDLPAAFAAQFSAGFDPHLLALRGAHLHIPDHSRCGHRGRNSKGY